MVYLRSGRATGDDVHVQLTKCLRKPGIPMGGMQLLYPMRVGEYISPDGGSKKYLAIVGRMTTCIGRGKDFVSAGDDAVFKMDAYFEDDYISDKATCYSFQDDPFHMERNLLETGIQWRGPVIDCKLFLMVAKGKVVSFGWQKKGGDTWRVYEEPKLQSLH